MDAGDELTEENASRLALTAVTSDLEYWARNASVDGHVGLNDLIQILDLIRLATAPESDGIRLAVLDDRSHGLTRPPADAHASEQTRWR